MLTMCWRMVKSLFTFRNSVYDNDKETQADELDDKMDELIETNKDLITFITKKEESLNRLKVEIEHLDALIDNIDKKLYIKEVEEKRGMQDYQANYKLLKLKSIHFSCDFNELFNRPPIYNIEDLKRPRSCPPAVITTS